MMRKIYRAYTLLSELGTHRFVSTIWWKYIGAKKLHRSSQKRLINSENISLSPHHKCGDFYCICRSIYERGILKHIAHQLQQSYQWNPDKLCADAISMVAGFISIFDTQVATILPIPWHTDPRFPHIPFSQTTPSHLITITPGMKDFSELRPDIKYPWELSRCHHIVTLAYAYYHTGVTIYRDMAYAHMHDWINENHFLHGVNWYNAMEVSIRAINWITALGLIQLRNQEMYAQCHEIVASLRQHYIFIETHWELYDGRTNNHYIANLIGYIILAVMFGDTARVQKTASLLCDELAWQIQNDYTSYEGSTSYHSFVLQLITSAYSALRAYEQPTHHVLTALHIYINNMQEFVTACTSLDNTLITIGDNDSGTVLPAQLPIAAPIIRDKPSVYNYPEFGLVIMRTNELHCSLRYPVYTARQPSGHFHADALSITLSWHNMNILTDPGSYVYTSSAAWRNHFRSHAVHNTFWIDNTPPILPTNNLFILDLATTKSFCTINQTHDETTLITFHDLYENSHNVRAWRKLCYNHIAQTIIITDWWELIGPLKNASMATSWNYTFGSMPHTDTPHTIVFAHGNTRVYLQTPFHAQLVAGWTSPAYGEKHPTPYAQGKITAEVQNIYTTILYV